MTIIDADKFLAYLIFSKHIDGMNCGEVKKEIEMCKVDVLDKIIAENSVKTDGDLISRKAVIQALKENAVEIGGEEYSGMGVCEEEIESIVNGVPSAEKTAEWINKNISAWECSNCGTTFYVIKKPFYIFCPNCGCRMKGEQTE